MGWKKNNCSDLRILLSLASNYKKNINITVKQTHLHFHSLYLHGLPGGLVAQYRSSLPSPQSSSESHLHVLRTHLRLSHWNSLGSQELPDPRGICQKMEDSSLIFTVSMHFKTKSSQKHFVTYVIRWRSVSPSLNCLNSVNIRTVALFMASFFLLNSMKKQPST